MQSAESTVIRALDKDSLQLGENGHPEVCWNTGDRTIDGLRDRVVQLFFQMVRVRGTPVGRLSTLRKLSDKYMALVSDAKRLPASAERDHLVRVLWALPTHTRDCVKGKGERDISYALLVAMYENDHIDDDEFVRVVQYWVGVSGKGDTAPPGSWKDVVNLCNFIASWTRNRSHPLISRLIDVLGTQLQVDDEAPRSITDEGRGVSLSLAAKWAPRESSKKNRWLFYRLVRSLNPALGDFATTPTSSPVFTGAARRTRKMLAGLNKHLGTLEVKQCGGRWSEIDATRVPAVALQKQKVALLNEIRRKVAVRIGPDGEPIPRSADPDRTACAENFRKLADAAASGDPDSKVRGQRASIYDFVRDAMVRGLSDAEKKILEAQWKDNGEQVCSGLPPMIPMVDVSESMTLDNCTPLYYAIGLGLRASEKTHPAFRHRVMTFSDIPQWVRLDDDSRDGETPSFVQRVQKVRHSSWGMNTDFYKALSMILTRLVENRVPPEDAKNLVLAVFSDMQIDAAATRGRGTPQTMQDTIKEMYAEHGYEPPHILYWNLRTTNGFPSVTTEKNVTMLSGFSPVLLNVLENKGVSGLCEYTPFRMVAELLDDDRFVV